MYFFTLIASLHLLINCINLLQKSLDNSNKAHNTHDLPLFDHNLFLGNVTFGPLNVR